MPYRSTWAPVMARILSMVSLALCVSPARAFHIYPLNETEAQKWGSLTTGTPATVTWSLIPDGTSLAVPFPDMFLPISGNSDLTSVYAQVGGESVARAAMQRAMDTWSSVAGIKFVEVSDDGSIVAGPAVPYPSVGHIRIGAFPINPGGGAVGYAPPAYPPYPDTLGGDILFNTLAGFEIVSGIEGDPIPPYTMGGLVTNDLEGLFLHELGHAIGIDHTEDTTAVMCGYVWQTMTSPACDYQHINRIPEPDDLDAIQLLYGTHRGDFNDTDTLDVDDIDQLIAERNAGTNNPIFDLTGDGLVNQDDVSFWVTDPSMAHTGFGDVTLDRRVNSSDAAILGGNFGTLVGATWGMGDFTGDGQVNSSDAAILGGSFGLDNSGLAAVPEPGSLALLAAGVLALITAGRKGREQSGTFRVSVERNLFRLSVLRSGTEQVPFYDSLTASLRTIAPPQRSRGGG